MQLTKLKLDIKMIIKSTLVFFATILLFTSSCVSYNHKHGYMFEFSDQHLLQEGVTSREKVLQIMGSPTVVSSLSDEETWIYFSETVGHFLFFSPKIKDRDLLAIRFDSFGLVKELKKVVIADEKKHFDFATDQTLVEDHGNNWIKSVFSNVGQVRPQ